MTDIEMHLIKMDILEMMELYSESLKKESNQHNREEILKKVWKLNKSLQLIDFTEQRILALSSELNANFKSKSTLSDYRVIAIEQSTKIEALNKTIVELVGKLDKVGGV